MKYKIIIIIVFVIVCLIQLAIPGKLIYDREQILSNGKEFKFRIRPLDPSDPIRGEYIYIRFTDDKVCAKKFNNTTSQQEVYLLISKDVKGGYVKPISISKELPAAGTDYIKIKLGYVMGDSININYPFERYYIDEMKASQMLKRLNRVGGKQSYLVVRVKDGEAVIKGIEN